MLRISKTKPKNKSNCKNSCKKRLSVLFLFWKKIAMYSSRASFSSLPIFKLLKKHLPPPPLPPYTNFNFNININIAITITIIVIVIVIARIKIIAIAIAIKRVPVSSSLQSMTHST